jgi:DNA repair and recombination protein RAD52
MFTKEQIEDLEKELESSRIKTREKGNIQLSYIEAHDFITTANRIFGYGRWEYSILSLEVASVEVNQNQNNIISYKAIVHVVVYNENHSQKVCREDVGFGSGIAKTLADTHESGAKEAVTDALKRAMRSFGNQFGNSLYDKSKNHQMNQQPQNNQSQTSYPPNDNNQQQRTNQPQNYQNQPANTQTPPKRNTPNIQSSQKPYQYQNDFSELVNVGLSVVEDGDILVVVGDEIFEKKNLIRNAGFRWSAQNKLWYMQLRQTA